MHKNMRSQLSIASILGNLQSSMKQSLRITVTSGIEGHEATDAAQLRPRR